MERRACQRHGLRHSAADGAAPPTAIGAEDEKRRLDVVRVFKTSLFGAGFVGPAGHLWYEGLDAFVRCRLALRPGSARFVAAKLVADTAFFGPLHLLAFFTYMGLADGHSLRQVKEDVARDFLPAFMTEGAVWPFVQAANFRFVPVEHQLLFVNCVCLLDSAFLSWFKFQDDAPWKRRLTSLVLRPKQDQPGAGATFDHLIANGRVLIGPNAALAMAKECYSFWNFATADMLRFAANAGLWRLVLGNFGIVVQEFVRDFIARAFVGEAQK
eukprot:SM000257S08646  [mRNA]  locus=s257:8966:10622:- [translate_table: standard]